MPPDFSVAGRIGVEVRRLNQNFEFPDGTREGLEELSIPLWQKFQHLLPTLGSGQNEESWFVGLDFRRPLQDWKTLRPLIEMQLRKFMSNLNRTPTTIFITPSLSLDILQASKYHGSFFILGASSDDDSGGLVMAEVERNLRLCIVEKEAKIVPFRSKYKTWWLLLADQIDFGMEPEDRIVFRRDVMPRISHTFDKIILVNPRNPLCAFEV